LRDTATQAAKPAVGQQPADELEILPQMACFFFKPAGGKPIFLRRKAAAWAE